MADIFFIANEFKNVARSSQEVVKMAALGKSARPALRPAAMHATKRRRMKRIACDPFFVVSSRSAFVHSVFRCRSRYLSTAHRFRSACFVRFVSFHSIRAGSEIDVCVGNSSQCSRESNVPNSTAQFALLFYLFWKKPYREKWPLKITVLSESCDQRDI